MGGGRGEEGRGGRGKGEGSRARVRVRMKLEKGSCDHFQIIELAKAHVTRTRIFKSPCL